MSPLQSTRLTEPASPIKAALGPLRNHFVDALFPSPLEKNILHRPLFSILSQHRHPPLVDSGSPPILRRFSQGRKDGAVGWNFKFQKPLVQTLSINCNFDSQKEKSPHRPRLFSAHLLDHSTDKDLLGSTLLLTTFILSLKYTTRFRAVCVPGGCDETRC